MALLHMDMTNRYGVYPIMTLEGKQINFGTPVSSISLFSTTMCTIGVKEWPHFDCWPLNQRSNKSAHCAHYQPLSSTHYQQEVLPDMTVLPISIHLFGFQFWTCMNCSSFFKGQKCNKVIYVSWKTLLFYLLTLVYSVQNKSLFLLVLTMKQA